MWGELFATMCGGIVGAVIYMVYVTLRDRS